MARKVRFSRASLAALLSGGLVAFLAACTVQPSPSGTNDAATVVAILNEVLQNMAAITPTARITATGTVTAPAQAMLESTATVTPTSGITDTGTVTETAQAALETLGDTDAVTPALETDDAHPAAQAAGATGVTVAEAELLLPELAVKPPEQLYIQINSDSGIREMRFSTSITNLGQGPLHLLGTHDPSTDRTLATQHILTQDGSTVERSAGSFIFHSDHDHWHFEDFTLFELWSYQPDGSLDQLLATTNKMSFCIRDDFLVPVSSPLPNTPPQIVYGDCEGVDIQGLSVGWEDVYDAETPGQYLDLTDVPDDRYAVRSAVDPLDRLMEMDETNNSITAYIEIQGLDVQVLPGP